MDENSKSDLLRAAARAMDLAVAPYSKFRVGAALLCGDDTVVCGANVESASYGLTCCAERVALFSALMQRQREFKAIAVVAAAEAGPAPCGACRQLLAEYAPDALVLVADSAALDRIRQFTVRQLLPEAFVEVPVRAGNENSRVSD